MMKNDKLEITPSEINKFVYCPYQWFYERKYGTKELRRLKADAAAEAGLGGKGGYKGHAGESNFIRGLQYHSGFLRRYEFKRRLFIFTAVVIMILLFFIVINYGR